MVEQSTLVAVATIIAGVGGGIGLVAWTEQQGKRTEERENIQLCTECSGDTTVVCNVCTGSCKDTLDNSKTCSYCDGRGIIKCFNCAGSGFQPRFLDRYVFSFSPRRGLLLRVALLRVLTFLFRIRLSPDDFMD